jgi:hypothetical protein
MNVMVIKRGRRLQFTSQIRVGDQPVNVTLYRHIDATTEEEFRKDVEDALKGGQEDVLAEVRLSVYRIIQDRKLAQEICNGLKVGAVEVVEPPPGRGICRVCLLPFELEDAPRPKDLCFRHDDAA